MIEYRPIVTLLSFIKKSSKINPTTLTNAHIVTYNPLP